MRPERTDSPLLLALNDDRRMFLQVQDAESGGGAKKLKKSGPIKRGMEYASQRQAGAAAAKTPNYMKPTTSSDARKERSLVRVKSPNPSCTRDGSQLVRILTKKPSFRPASKNCEARRGTCSSTLKDRKFPAYLALNRGGTQSEGTSAIRVCPYTYCSLNGCHRAPLPPLKCFLSARRAQMRISSGEGLNLDAKFGVQDDLGSTRIGAVRSEKEGDLFVEVLSEKMEDRSIAGRYEMVQEDRGDRAQETVLDSPICDAVGVDDCCEGLDSNLVEVGLDLASDALDKDLAIGNGNALFLSYESECSSEFEMGCDCEAGSKSVDDKFVCESDEKGNCVGEVLAEEVLEELNDKGSDSGGELNGCMQSLVDLETSTPVYGDADQIFFGCDPTPEIDLQVPHNADEEEIAFDDLENKRVEGSPVDTDLPKEDYQAGGIEVTTISRTAAKRKNIEQENVTTITQTTAKRKKTEQEEDELGAFNPRGPNFLPVKPDPEAEKVDLRHQELDETKNAEEWMVDYALRQAVTKLGPARKRKVALLVEAFEKVMPIAKWELPVGHDTSAVFDLPRPIQACR